VRSREERSADFFSIEPRYFDTLRIPILRGRALNDLDSLATVPVALVNESFARCTWPGEDPLGREVRMLDDSAGRWYRIVGVAADTRDRGRGIDPHPAIYASYYQSLGRTIFLLIRTRPDPMSLAPAIRRAIVSLNGQLPLDRVAPLDLQIAESIGTQRFATVLAGLFAALALSLCAVGVYGVTACAVSQRTHEIGIRIALGASPGAVIGMFLREAARLASAGLAAGVFTTIALTRFLQDLLYGIHAYDPVTFGVALILLAILTALASLLPALRAMHVEPVIALRCE
jgi:putative ABC transport system permease protein